MEAERAVKERKSSRPPSVPVSGQGAGICSCGKRLGIREQGACCSQQHEMTDQQSDKKGAKIAPLLLTFAGTQFPLYGHAAMSKCVLFSTLLFFPISSVYVPFDITK